MRCSRASEIRLEPQVGTASTVTSFLLVEAPGAWGVDVPGDSRIPSEAKAWLSDKPELRPLLMRRGASRTRRVFLARDGRIRTTELRDLHELTDLDLDRDLTPYDGSLFLVCTHGRHDACCAERGRPLWAALTEAAPDETWQVSHIGGDRFAANVLVLPNGLYYGRVSPAHAAALVAEHRAGRLDLDHLRGRCAYPFAVQAAEIFLRRELGEAREGAVRLESYAGTTAVFEREGRRWRVEVVRTATHEQLTCRAAGPAEGWTFEPGAIVALN